MKVPQIDLTVHTISINKRKNKFCPYYCIRIRANYKAFLKNTAREWGVTNSF